MKNKNKIENKYSCILSNIQRNPWPFWITHLSGDLTHISQHRSEDSHECCLASDIFLIFRSYQICPLSIIDLSIYQQHNTCWALACDFNFPVSISLPPIRYDEEATGSMRCTWPKELPGACSNELCDHNVPVDEAAELHLLCQSSK